MWGPQVLWWMRRRPRVEPLRCTASRKPSCWFIQLDVCVSQVIKLFCLLRKIRKISTYRLCLFSITSFLLYLRSRFPLSASHPGQGLWCKKTQTGHKSAARWGLRGGECLRLCPPACRHSQYKYISQKWPLCVSVHLSSGAPSSRGDSLVQGQTEWDNKLRIDMRVILTGVWQ